VPPDATPAARGGLEHRPAHGCTIEQVGRDRLSAKRRMCFAFSADLEVPITSWPRSTSWGTSLVPIAPI
jgi:hypothetical protein